MDKKQLTLDDFLDRLDINQLKIDLRLNETGDSTEYDENQPLITIANQRNKNSVLNIALSSNKNKAGIRNFEDQRQDEKVIEKHEENVLADQNLNHQLSSTANYTPMKNMKYDVDESKDECDSYIESSNIRHTKHRKAKLNHTFLSK